MVTLVKFTSVILASHLLFGHTSAGLGSCGAAVVTLKLILPFLTSVIVCEPDATTEVSCPGALFPPGLMHTTSAVPSALTTTLTSWFPSPAALPVQVIVWPLSVHVGVPTKCGFAAMAGEQPRGPVPSATALQ
jgi:hypothetical protein